MFSKLSVASFVHTCVHFVMTTNWAHINRLTTSVCEWLEMMSEYIGANVFCTGASRGIGLGLVRHLLAKPEVECVFAGARNPKEARVNFFDYWVSHIFLLFRTFRNSLPPFQDSKSLNSTFWMIVLLKVPPRRLDETWGTRGWIF